METGNEAFGSGLTGKIPCVMMYEHRDAYCCWVRFVHEGRIAKSGNYLLHVDNHADYGCSLYGWDLTRMPQTPEEALRFTDADLGIEDFIVPALWQGIFSTFHCLQTVGPKGFKDETHLLHLKSGNTLERRCSVTTSLEEKAKAEPGRYRIYTYREGGLYHKDRIESDSIVLDVDLDYFCTDDSLHSGAVGKIEITREAFDEYWGNRHHPLRIAPSLQFDAKEIEGRYYLVERKPRSTAPLPSDQLILKRINRLISYLAKQEVRPRAIDVCRSTISGYLPAEKAAFVEENFMERLGELYPLEVTDFDG